MRDNAVIRLRVTEMIDACNQIKEDKDNETDLFDSLHGSI